MPGSTTNMGLVTWTLLTDFFSHTDLVNNWSKVDGHDHVPVGSGGNGGAPIPAAGIQNGAVTNPKLAANAVDTSNIVDNAVTGAKIANGIITPDKFSESRGAAIIPATESRSNATYGVLTTPDRVTGVVLPSNGLIAIAYQATWQGSVGGGAAKAAIFIGANQLVTIQGGGPVAAQFAIPGGGVVASDCSLATSAHGLASMDNHPYGGDATTGQPIAAQTPGGAGGGPCYIFAAAGTYDISIQFSASSGSVTVKNRKLWVWTMAF